MAAFKSPPKIFLQRLSFLSVADMVSFDAEDRPGKEQDDGTLWIFCDAFPNEIHQPLGPHA
ncbi:hypothetical protein NE609_12350 [Anaerotruncus sp. DFI.9.16]|uniref:hypothetical protein n=1 Tax=Anaerotruncus massiliensis (ex Liu et al. 2021) TaxID=2321404 RepID=UPI0018F5DA11|nr:hypothetical protein [Anaerotruncus massiliensis (ex Liu et al. 2021)]MCQ4896691.1 hypothetical protein [Anaerotruncus sp. DFI.9.16]